MVARTMFETWDDLLANQTIDGGKGFIKTKLNARGTLSAIAPSERNTNSGEVELTVEVTGHNAYETVGAGWDCSVQHTWLYMELYSVADGKYIFEICHFVSIQSSYETIVEDDTTHQNVDCMETTWNYESRAGQGAVYQFSTIKHS
ncbi:hypothetical protein D0Y65_022154 [Glycine soja]|nr:hypothetical protein D0Y65_022154 [Glycine soja]